MPTIKLQFTKPTERKFRYDVVDEFGPGSVYFTPQEIRDLTGSVLPPFELEMPLALDHESGVIEAEVVMPTC